MKKKTNKSVDIISAEEGAKVIEVPGKKKKLVKKAKGTFTYSGDRKELVAKLVELYENGKIKVADVARVGQVKTSSASCWIRGVSLPTENRISALVDFINSISE